jgi:hypothetical protein
MPVRKKDPSLGRRHLKNFVVLGVPFTLAFLAAIYAHRQQRTDWFITAFVVGFVVALIGLVRQERLFRRYRCPQCGARLSESPRKNGQPIEFFCQHCDIIWDSGFIESEVSGG